MDTGPPLKLLKRAAARIRQPRKILNWAWHMASRPILSLFPGSNLARFCRRQMFRGVYCAGSWGSQSGELYFSGIGSVGEPSKVYVDAMAPIIAELARVLGDQTTIVDLGCGDFGVGDSLLRRLSSVRYVGCDIVPEVIAANTRRYATRNVSFMCMDIVTQELPPGSIYLVRQVFQHMPNGDIARVLAKLRDRENVYVTEGQPEIREGPVNPEKPPGIRVRFNLKTGRGRGVELDQYPFNLLVDEVCRASAAPGKSREIIITQRVRRRAADGS
jgi:hypothetical protein